MKKSKARNLRKRESADDAWENTDDVHKTITTNKAKETSLTSISSKRSNEYVLKDKSLSYSHDKAIIKNKPISGEVLSTKDIYMAKKKREELRLINVLKERCVEDDNRSISSASEGEEDKPLEMAHQDFHSGSESSDLEWESSQLQKGNYVKIQREMNMDYERAERPVTIRKNVNFPTLDAWESLLANLKGELLEHSESYQVATDAISNLQSAISESLKVSGLLEDEMMAAAQQYEFVQLFSSFVQDFSEFTIEKLPYLEKLLDNFFHSFEISAETASSLIEDAARSISEVQQLIGKIGDFRNRFPLLFEQGYVELTIPDLMEFFVKFEFLTRNPFVNKSPIQLFNWFSALASFEGDDSIIPTTIKKHYGALIKRFILETFVPSNQDHCFALKYQMEELSDFFESTSPFLMDLVQSIIQKIVDSKNADNFSFWGDSRFIPKSYLEEAMGSLSINKKF